MSRNRYRLYREPEAGRCRYDGPGRGQPAGVFRSLKDAMRAAGHPDPAHWYTTAGLPDVIHVDWTLYYDKKRHYKGTEYLCLPWTIQAPGVAGEYAELLTADAIPGGRP